MSTRKPWPKDGLYINELIDTLVNFYEKPDGLLTSSGEWKENLKSKLLNLKQVSAGANVVTVDDLIEHLKKKNDS
jgi:hypothetical protein